MRKRTYPAGQRFALLHVETLYRKLDAGLCCGVPVAAGVGVCVDCIAPPDLLRQWREDWGRVTRPGCREPDTRVLCRAEIDGAPAYGWLLLSWLEPVNQQSTLFETSQPTLF